MFIRASVEVWVIEQYQRICCFSTSPGKLCDKRMLIRSSVEICVFEQFRQVCCCSTHPVMRVDTRISLRSSVAASLQAICLDRSGSCGIDQVWPSIAQAPVKMSGANHMLRLTMLFRQLNICINRCFTKHARPGCLFVLGGGIQDITLIVHAKCFSDAGY